MLNGFNNFTQSADSLKKAVSVVARVMDGALHRQLERVNIREFNRRMNGAVGGGGGGGGRPGVMIYHPHNHSQKSPQYDRLNIDLDDSVISYEPDEKSLPGVYIHSKPLQVEKEDFFEVEIMDTGVSGEIAIGLVPYTHPLDQFPGLNSSSVGVHFGDGRLYMGHQRGTIVTSTRCEVGDRIGCGIRFDSAQIPMNKQNAKVNLIPIYPLMKLRAFFTINRVEITSTLITPPVLRGGLYPAIGLGSPGEEVKLEMNMKWVPPSIPRNISDDTLMCVDSNEEEWMRLHDVRINGSFLEYSGRGKSILDVGLAQARHCLTTRYHYFEIEIVDPGENCYIAIGLTKKEYPRHSHPGWNKGSIAYHADDGKIFIGSGSGHPFGPRCHRGDVMGCGIIFAPDYNPPATEDFVRSSNHRDSGDEFEPAYQCGKMSEEPDTLQHSDLSDQDDDYYDNGSDDSDDYREDEQWIDDFNNDLCKKRRSQRPKGPSVEVFFTRNGVVVGQKEIKIPSGGFYPTVGMLSVSEKVKVDLHPLTG